MGGSAYSKEQTPDSAAPAPAFAPYTRTQLVEVRPYIEGELLSSKVTVLDADRAAGSPKAGDVIARDPNAHDDQWLVTKSYFEAHYKPVESAPGVAEAG